MTNMEGQGRNAFTSLGEYKDNGKITSKLLLEDQLQPKGAAKHVHAWPPSREVTNNTQHSAERENNGGLKPANGDGTLRSENAKLNLMVQSRSGSISKCSNDAIKLVACKSPESPNRKSQQKLLEHTYSVHTSLKAVNIKFNTSSNRKELTEIKSQASGKLKTENTQNAFQHKSGPD